MKKTVPFRYTFPILKAEQREDGRYITGEASGPEVDATDERMSPECIDKFAAQITARAQSGDPLTYRDAHASDGVLRDLGSITRGWVDDRTHLGIEVKLEDGNPAAEWLFNSIDKGKKWGMSIAGHVEDYKDEFVAELGKAIRTYKDVVLTEISNTTRPAWTPSFGTVLSKAIADAEDIDAFESVTSDEAKAESDAEGENVGKNTLQADEQAAPSDADATKNTEEAVEESLGDDEAPVTDKTAADEAAAETTDETTEKSSEAAQDAVSMAYSIASLIGQLGDEEDPDNQADLKAAIALLQGVQNREIAEIGTPEDAANSTAQCQNCGATVAMSAPVEAVDVEKAGRAVSAANEKKLVDAHKQMASVLSDMGCELGTVSAKKDSSDAEPDLVKAWDVEKTTLTTKIEELERTLTEKTARVEELEAMPATQAPALVRSEDKDEALAKALASMTPQERMRFGLTLKHQ